MEEDRASSFCTGRLSFSLTGGLCSARPKGPPAHAIYLCVFHRRIMGGGTRNTPPSDSQSESTQRPWFLL